MHAQRRRTSSSSLLFPPALPECGDALGAASTWLLAAAVLPEQFFSARDRPYTDRGEVALMRAVLEDALTCVAKQFSSRGRRSQRLAREAEAWFFADDDHWPFAFVNICAVLDFTNLRMEENTMATVGKTIRRGVTGSPAAGWHLHNDSWIYWRGRAWAQRRLGNPNQGKNGLYTV